MTTKFKPEEWWPVLALHACGYTMSVYEAKGLLTVLSKQRCSAKQWSDGRFEERGQPAFLASAISTLGKALEYSIRNRTDLCAPAFTVGETFAIYLALAGKSHWAMRFLDAGVASLMSCFYRALNPVMKGATPEDAETILDSRIEPVIWQIGRDFYLAAGGKKEK